MEETTGAPSSFAVYRPRRLRASSRDGGDGVNRPPSTLTMLLSRHTRRRDFIAIVGTTVGWSIAAKAQQSDSARQVRIGVIGAVPPSPDMLNAFRDAMRDRGYIEGQNLTLYVRSPKGTFEQDPSAVADLLRAKVDVIVAWSTPAVIAVSHATSETPIVMASVGDPVGSGFVASLAHPGGNITGVSIITSDLSAKLLGLFVQMVPTMRVIGLVTNAYNPNVAMQLRETQDAISKLRLQSEVVEARNSEGFRSRFCKPESASRRWHSCTSGPCGDRPQDTHCRACTGSSVADRFSTTGERGGWWSLFVWRQYSGSVQVRSIVCRSYLERSKACRFAGRATNPVRFHHQCQDCQDTRIDHSVTAPRRSY